MTEPSVGAVIVTCQSARVVGACLEAVLSRVDRVVVVDNASTDDTLAVVRGYPEAGLLANPQNLGFAAAANQGFQSLDTGMVLLLNPDAVLLTGVEPLAAACGRPGFGAAAGRLLAPSGGDQRGFVLRRFPTPLLLCLESLGVNRLWPNNPWNRRYRCLDLDLDAGQTAEQPAGALLMLRRDVWSELEGFDERFFPLWFEDVDLLRRLRRRGYKVWYEPGVRALHQGGHSLVEVPEAKRLYYWYDNLLRYAAKHFSRACVRAVAAAVWTGVWMRRIVARPVTGIPGTAAETAVDCGKVLRLAGCYFRTGNDPAGAAGRLRQTGR